jgi:hypothetical protein
MPKISNYIVIYHRTEVMLSNYQSQIIQEEEEKQCERENIMHF